MSSTIVLFCVLFTCSVFAPESTAKLISDAGWIGKLGLIFAGSWATYHDIRTRVGRKVLRRISRDPDLYMDGQ